jgi:hypothetical protein
MMRRDVSLSSEWLKKGSEDTEEPRSAGSPADLSSRARRNADLAFLFREREALQRKEGSDHIFTYSLSLFLCSGSDLAVNRKGRVAPA